MLQDRIISSYSRADPQLAYAMLCHVEKYGPSPATPREARFVLSGAPEQMARVQLRPEICGDFCVTDLNHQVSRPDTYLPGSATREESAYYNAHNPNIDLTMESNRPGRPIRFADENKIEAVTWRTAGDPRTSICDCCWVLYFCDRLTVRIITRRTLPPSEVGSVVTVTFLGYDLGCELKTIDRGNAVAGLKRAGYLI